MADSTADSCIVSSFIQLSIEKIVSDNFRIWALSFLNSTLLNISEHWTFSYSKKSCPNFKKHLYFKFSPLSQTFQSVTNVSLVTIFFFVFAIFNLSLCYFIISLFLHMLLFIRIWIITIYFILYSANFWIISNSCK